MKYIIDIRFEDSNYNAIIHFVTIFTAKSEQEASLFVNQLVEGFKRRNATVLFSTYTRIDNDPRLQESQYKYYNFCMTRATANVKIEQFELENPDQNKSLSDNMIENLFNGTNSTALIGQKYNIPVRVTEKHTQNPISADIFYHSIEQLIPRKSSKK